MRYFVGFGPNARGSMLEVDVTELPSGELGVVVGGKQVIVDAVPVPGALSVRVDGRVVDLVLEGQPPDLGIIANGHRSYVRVESERQRSAGAVKRRGGA